MLQLKHIVKNYESGGASVTALKDISIDFRNSEFVSILGHSGCGKTTLLNLIGGLDHYTDGDLIIRGKSTKEFKDADWDAYRNHSIGFVFQSYNLIPHQSVLSNVELALTLSGVSKSERRQRAIDALTKVGLADQIHKRPSQMSGGQMQRVAIARALVNDPDILLADEPTGALDTATSVQIMEILKEISKDKLIIMVTHNPELAELYSTRIVKLQDGLIVSDSMPYDAEAEAAKLAAETPVSELVTEGTDGAKPKKKKEKRLRNKSMSYLTALSLSLNNLMTKKGRTILTSFAGSIGIIGIALILSLSNGINLYIAQVQEDALSTYPLSIQENTQDFSALLGAMTEVQESREEERDPNKIYVDDSMDTMMSAMTSTISNNLEAFKAHIDKHSDEIGNYVSDIQYTYNFDLQVFSADGKTQVSPTKILDSMGFTEMTNMMETASASGMNVGGMSVLSEMINNQTLLNQQYDVIAGNWPAEDNEVVLVVREGNRINKMTLYMLGILDQSELKDIMNGLMQGNQYESEPIDPFTFNDFLGMEFKLLNTSDFFVETDKTYPDLEQYHVWNDVRDDIGYDQASYVTENGITLKISGIIRPKENATATSIQGTIGYTKGLTDLILEMNADSKVINQQKKAPEYNVLTGLKFERTTYTKETIGKLIDSIDEATMDMIYAYMTEQLHAVFSEKPPVNAETFAVFAYIMDRTQQAQLIGQMLTVASQIPDNAASLQMLCNVLSQMLTGVTVTPENLVTLLPAMTTEQIMLAIMGAPASETMPVAITGLQQMCGETTMAEIYAYMNAELLNMTVNEDNFVQLLQAMSEDEFATLQDTLYEMAPQTDATLESNLYLLGDAEKAKPASINFYAKDFESKEKIVQFIADYNESVEEKDQMNYTDMVGILMSSVTTIVDFVSYALIAFVSISLVVSSIMIGIITYISVLERTKEIGILRAIGASKRDISRVFNAETLIVGFAAGALGILITLLLCIPANMIFEHYTDIERIAVLPPAGLFLIVLSVVLTMIAGFFPSKMAAKKDPVEALRTE
ncbi:MAG: ABC transporter ATP-binding protein/permease [Clostridia bacterium]|nr:ABC transporter ATP-binding protein/permease [Clostridia bacterium]